MTDGVGSDDRIEAAIDDLTIETLVCAPQDADVDNDNDVDLADYALMQSCHTGAGTCLCHPALYDDAGAPECIAADLQLDGDVDLADHDLFAAGMTRPLPIPAVPRTIASRTNGATESQPSSSPAQPCPSAMFDAEISASPATIGAR